MHQSAEMPERSPQGTSESESLELWIEELAHHLEIEDVRVNVDAVQGLAGQAREAVGDDAEAVTTFLVGYVTGLAEASGQADFQTASRAASRVAERLLQRRSSAVG